LAVTYEKGHLKILDSQHVQQWKKPLSRH